MGKPSSTVVSELLPANLADRWRTFRGAGEDVGELNILSIQEISTARSVYQGLDKPPLKTPTSLTLQKNNGYSVETLRYDRACYDLSLQPEQFYRYAISKEFDSDEIYLAKHKIGSIAIDNVSDSLATLNNTELELAGNDTNEGDETMGI